MQEHPHLYEVTVSDGTKYDVNTPHHYGDHPEHTFKDHLLDIIKGGRRRHHQRGSSRLHPQRARASAASERPMNAARGTLSAALGVLVALSIAPLVQAAAPSPAEVAERRSEMLRDMMTDKWGPDLIAGVRRHCAIGGEPASVVKDRAEGAYFTSDAADECVTVLIRTAHDRRLPEIYRKLMAESGGNISAAGTLPQAIGAAVLNGSLQVAIGNGKVATVTPALAFDAGFTNAYQEGQSSKAPTADRAKLGSVAEACLAQHQTASLCFSVGYVYGALAVRGWTATSP